MEIMLDKKQIFLLEFKMGHKATEKTCNINNTFGPGTAKKTYSTEMVREVLQRRWEPWRWEAQWLTIKVDNN